MGFLVWDSGAKNSGSTRPPMVCRVPLCDFQDYRSSLAMVADLKPFPHEIASIDLASGDYSVELEDPENEEAVATQPDSYAPLPIDTDVIERECDGPDAPLTITESGFVSIGEQVASGAPFLRSNPMPNEVIGEVRTLRFSRDTGADDEVRAWRFVIRVVFAASPPTARLVVTWLCCTCPPLPITWFGPSSHRRAGAQMCSSGALVVAQRHSFHNSPDSGPAVQPAKPTSARCLSFRVTLQQPKLPCSNRSYSAAPNWGRRVHPKTHA